MLDNATETQTFSVEEQEQLDALDNEWVLTHNHNVDEFNKFERMAKEKREEGKTELIAQFEKKRLVDDKRNRILKLLEDSDFTFEELFKEEVDEVLSNREREIERETLKLGNQPNHRLMDANGQTWHSMTALHDPSWADYRIDANARHPSFDKPKIGEAGLLNPVWAKQLATEAQLMEYGVYSWNITKALGLAKEDNIPFHEALHICVKNTKARRAERHAKLEEQRGTKS